MYIGDNLVRCDGSVVSSVGKILSPRHRISPGVATEAPSGAHSPKRPSVMTVHHQNHHTAALSGITVPEARNGLNLSRMSGPETHRLDNHHHQQPAAMSENERNGWLVFERLSNSLEGRNNAMNSSTNNNNVHSHSADERVRGRADAATTMPPRSRFMITDILADASSPVSQEPPGSPPSGPRDLSVRHQSRQVLKRKRDDDSDASHHDGASVSSNGKTHFYLLNQQQPSAITF